MAGESQQTPATPPDPSVLATEQAEKGLKAERDYVDGKLDAIIERLNGMDAATVVRLHRLDQFPHDIDEKVLHLRELAEEKFDSIEKQFKERDTRSERESRDNKVAVDAAFAAQKEAAQKQDESNAKAIDKSEAATNEAISKLGQLFETSNKALADKIDDVKKDLGETKQLVNGAARQQQGGTDSTANMRAAITIGVTVMLFLLTAAGFVIALTAK